MRAICVHLLVLALLLGAAPARAQSAAQVEARAGDVVAALRGQQPFAEVFAPAFAEAVPQARFDELAKQFEQQFGQAEGIEFVRPTGAPGAAAIAVRYERAIARGDLQLESAAPWRVAGLRFTAFEPIGDDAGKIAADLAALPGTASAYLARLDGGEVLLDYRASEQMAIGSAFKLYVLSALAHEVAAGKRKWSDVVPLSARSLPSGQMQDWPQGAPVTLHTLAAMMIAISDNTATDTLIALLGRETVEAELAAAGHARPQENMPFLTTREVFLLKSGDASQLYTYAHAPEADRRDMLADLAGAVPDPAQLSSAMGALPRALDVEWFASGPDLARVFDRIRRLQDPVARQILAINPGMAQGSTDTRWTYAGFKGGSEPGVIYLAWLLQDKAGAWYVATLGWNDPDAPVDQQRLTLLSQRVLALVPGR